jgi:hypothetical protein
MLPIQNGLEQGKASMASLFTFALEYAINKVKVKQEGL